MVVVVPELEVGVDAFVVGVGADVLVADPAPTAGGAPAVNLPVRIE